MERATAARLKKWAAAEQDKARVDAQADLVGRAEQFVDAMQLPAGDAAGMAAAADQAVAALAAADPVLAGAVNAPGVRKRLRARKAAAVVRQPRAAPSERLDSVALAQLLKRHCAFKLPPVGTALTPEHAPAAGDETLDVLTAIAYRDYLASHKRTLVCVVCACRVSAAEVEEEMHLLSDLPGLELLSADRTAHPPTPSHPRDAITTLEWPASSGERYCLTQAGVTGTSAGGEPLVRVCSGCHKKLSSGNIPPRSLVCVDTGTWPCDDVGPLPEMTAVEEALVAPVTVLSRVMIMRAANEATGAARFTLKKTLIGHVVVLPGPTAGELAGLLPRPFTVLGETFLVSS